ncbi:carbon-nitrogen hydrolase family protein [Pseudomonas sp. G34]|uniref:carbon-nitrogen hydrolase family protein n=1 Tax=Pseudomonas sp. G34 TaxID=3059083 RepID=UPI00280A22FB|nr:carbon-nitrogen hydrolase family protein [Pseudomonas sp. G34]MDQ7986429.1 carbon-nitrogen hydrolase family protein [Pseudomonas sp. G34]
MASPVLVAAQCAVQAGDLAANLALHLNFMRHASELGAGLIIFPELSLSGYEPALADTLAQPADSPLLEPLCSLTMAAGMTTVVGLPLRVPGYDRPQIAACILHPDGSRAIYTKQYLHAGEERFFSAGQGGELLLVGGMSVALSVCAEFAHAEHPAKAAERGALVYAASVLVGEGGYPHDSSLLQGYAQRHGMAVLMANHGGPTGGWAAAGRSALWDEQGRCVASTLGVGHRLLVVSRQADGWQGSDIALSA